MTRRRTAILAIALSLGLVLGACGDDTSPSAGDGGSGTGEGGGFTVTVSADGIEIPDEVTGGVVEVTLETDIEEADINFSKVAAGTTEDQLKEALVQAVSGAAIPELIEAETGLTGSEGGGGSATLVLPEGDYFAWTERGGDEGEGEEAPEGEATEGEAPEGEEGGEGGPGEGGPSPDDFLTAAFTVTAGTEGDLPDLDGNSITARDYTFDINMKSGAEEFVFRNEGPAQFHHAEIMNFGKIEASVVEENLPALFSTEEGQEPPEVFKDIDLDEAGVGHTTVLSPGLGTTATTAELESGNTYVVLCFISDRAGGPPHAIGHNMRTVFTVE